jgi:hypothetical protein
LAASHLLSIKKEEAEAKAPGVHTAEAQTKKRGKLANRHILKGKPMRLQKAA